MNKKAPSGAASERQRGFAETEAAEMPAESAAKAACPDGADAVGIGGTRQGLLVSSLPRRKRFYARKRKHTNIYRYVCTCVH